MSPSPSIDVIIPTYNRARILNRALSSLVGQTFQDFQTIVVDDGSDDDTADIVKSYPQPQFIYHRLATNCGPAKARNVGIALATAPYIAFLDSDDEYLPGKLESQFDRIRDAAADVGAVYCHAYLRHDPWPCLFVPREKQIDQADVRQRLLSGWTPTMPAALIKRCYIEKFDILFDERFANFEDLDFWLRLSEHCALMEMPDRLVVINRNQDLARLTTSAEERLASFELFSEKWSSTIVRESGQATYDAFRRGIVTWTKRHGFQQALHKGRLTTCAAIVRDLWRSDSLTARGLFLLAMPDSLRNIYRILAGRAIRVKRLLP